MRTFPRRYAERLVPSNVDEALFGWPIVAGGSLNQLNAEFHVVGPEEQRTNTILMYGISGWIVPINDMDDASTLDTLWDLFVPKDEAESAGGFDLDEAADAQPEFAAGGELDWNSIFEITEAAPLEIFRRRKMISVASNPVGYTSLVATQSDDTYTPTDHFVTKIRKRYSVRQASMLIFGFSAPVLDQVRAPSVDIVPTEKQWMQLSYLDLTLEQAIVSAIGLTEAGAESPYEEALSWISEYLEPNIVNDTTGAFATEGFQVFGKATADITVPSKRGPKQLSSE